MSNQNLYIEVESHPLLRPAALCLYDAAGPCGNPVKDAQRVKTREQTTRTLTVVWGVAGYEERRDTAVDWYRELLERVGGAVQPVTVVDTG